MRIVPSRRPGVPCPFRLGPICTWRDQRQLRAAASPASAVRDRATRIGPVAVGKERVPGSSGYRQEIGLS